jgi:5,10-methylenetetrahydromethanopterin reductase
VGELAEAARTAERLGFDQVWFPDSQLLWRDVFATLAAAAQVTERIQLGSAVTNLVTRHPSVLASAARTVAELAPGRFVLGVGAGNSAVLPAGLPVSTQAQLRERLAVVRGLLAGEECQLGTARARLRDPAPGTPVYLAASGPRNLALAGELADGVILLSGVWAEGLAASRRHIARGALAAGRRLTDLDLVVSAFGLVTDDLERDARLLKPICAAMAQAGGGPALGLAGVEVQVPAAVPDVYPDLAHAEDWQRAVRRCGDWVSDRAAVRFAEAFCLCGTAGELTRRIGGLAEAGVTSLFIQHAGSYSLPHELMAVISSILPALRRPAGESPPAGGRQRAESPPIGGRQRAESPPTGGWQAAGERSGGGAHHRRDPLGPEPVHPAGDRDRGDRQ